MSDYLDAQVDFCCPDCGCKLRAVRGSTERGHGLIQVEKAEQPTLPGCFTNIITRGDVQARM